MEKFIYHGIDEAGNSVTETVTAADRFAVYAIARDNGHTVESIKEKSGFSLSMINVEKIEYAISRVKLDELVLVSRNLGAMLTAGLPLSRALSVIERQSKNPRLKVIIVNVRERINGGDQFNEALADHLIPLMTYTLP